ncbi:AP-1 complex subunit beta-1 [Desmophyllum pertusum]|uniref:AP-1 complex subunit beta-1 n=1 Tax=Desmophyllum pertusum TaxID=174260 RepID=A0A9W9Z5X3_9CNID|nr:AP-1 complex subunit beta-1 [Desmophyllum pertusum]
MMISLKLLVNLLFIYLAFESDSAIQAVNCSRCFGYDDVNCTTQVCRPFQKSCSSVQVDSVKLDGHRLHLHVKECADEVLCRMLYFLYSNNAHVRVMCCTGNMCNGKTCDPTLCIMTDSKYFTTTKKGEIFELKAELNSDKKIARRKQ